MERKFTPIGAQIRIRNFAGAGRLPSRFRGILSQKPVLIACLFVLGFASTPVFAQAPTADDQSVSTNEDVALAITLTGSDPDLDPLTFMVVTGPSNGVLSGTAPNLTYTPNLNYNGPDSFTFTANDGALTSPEATVTITVDAVNDAPSADAQSVSTNEDVALAITLTGTDVELDPLTFMVVTGPSNGVLSGTAPNLTYTPNLDYNGPDSFTFTVDDGEFGSVEAAITITVDAVNDAPTADAQSLSTPEDTDLLITLTGTDVELDPLTFAVVVVPGNGVLSGTAPNLTYSPNLDYNGPDSFTFTVNDGEFTSAEATITITVDAGNDAPTADAQTVSTDEDVALAITLTGTDPELDPLTFAVVVAPINGVLSGTAPDLTYTPNVDFNGADSFTFTVDDGEFVSAEATITITVDAVNDAPLADAQSLSTPEETDLLITLTGTDVELDPLTFAVVVAPINGVLTGTAPDLTYTPNLDFNGADSFTFTVDDGEFTSAEETITITVDAVNDAPLADAQSLSTPEDTDLLITLTGTDIELDPLTFVVVIAPTNGVLTGTAPDLTYTPNLDFNGADSFTFTVDDGEFVSAEATITITVDAVNDAPIADTQSLSTPEDTDLLITLTGTDVELDPLTFVVVVAPINGVLTGTAPDLTYTPNLDFNGVDSFTFTVDDGEFVSAEATITITIDAGNDAPSADAQAVVTDEDVALAITLTGTDAELDPLTFVVVTGPVDGVLSGTAPDLTYTPNLDFNGTDSFTFTVDDGEFTSAEATVTITVNAVNDVPTADAQAVSTPEDTALAITLTGSDIELDPLTFVVVTGPTDGTLTGTAPDVTYTPNLDFNGPDSFTFTVNDGNLTSAEATITITVDAGNDAPTADAQAVTTDEDVAFAITLTGTDIELDPLTFAVVIGPTDGVLTGTAPDLTYTPNLDFNGTDSFTFTVDDAEFTSAEAAITITVNAVNDAPTADAQSVSTPEDTPLPILLTGTDVESDPLTFIIGTGPTNGTLTGVAPDITYTPNLNYNGPDSFTFTVDDSSLTSVEATITITADAVNDEPIVAIIIDDQLAVEGTAFDVDISGNFTDADNDPLQFTASGLPISGNLSIDPITGVFSGTPRVEDARDNDPYIITVTATDGDLATIPAEDTFELNISALDRANVSLEISVAPDPAMLNDELRWDFTVRNSVGPQLATNVVLNGSFVGSGLNISSPGNSCTIQAAIGQVTAFDCTLGDLPLGGSTTVVLTTLTSAPGDVVVFGTAMSADPIPIDPNLADNSSQIAVGVAEAFSNGAVQVLGSANVRSVAAGDVDGDGVADMIVGTAAGQPIQIYLSGGYRDFLTPPISLADTSANEAIALADFDGNGTLDLVVANGGGQADVVYGNDGNGIFTLMATLSATFGQDVAVGDFDDNGIFDIVVATIQGNPVYLGDGLGGFVLHTTLGVDENSRGVAVGEFDNDALDDIVFANVGSGSQIWLKNIGVGFSPGVLTPFGDAVAVTVGEFGGDARPDLAFARVPSVVGDVPANPILVNDGNGGFASPIAELGTSPTNDIHAGDLDGDGLSDLVFINASGVHQIWHATGGDFELHREQIVDGNSIVGVVADLGMTDVGDAGGVDLAMGGAIAAGLGVFLNDGFGNLGRGDAVSPVLTLLGDVTISVPSGSTYLDSGATAADNIDGDISSAISVVNTVNTTVVGDYAVTYNVADFAGNSATPVTRTVTVTPAAGTGGGGGGASNTLFLLLLMLVVWQTCDNSGRRPIRRMRMSQ